METLGDLKMQGRKALVTGASKGIGLAIARELASQGCDVMLVSRKEPVLQEIATQIAQEFGVKALFHAAHCGKDDAIAAVAKDVEERMGGLDFLVNNAATNPAFGFSVDFPTALFRKILDTNLIGYQGMVQAHLSMLEKSDVAAVVNISSEAGLRPAHFMGMYSVAKAGVNMMTKVLARELGPRGVRVNAVAPGLVKTDFSRVLWENESVLKEVLSKQALDKLAEPEDIARAVTFLLSPASAMTTGVVLSIDGGSTL